MMAGRGEIAGLADWAAGVLHWTGVTLSQAAVGGTVATVAGAAAGQWLGRRRP